MLWVTSYGSAKFGDLVIPEELQLSETLLDVRKILTWNLSSQKN